MKVTQISKHIWRLHAWLLFPINVWAIKEEDGITLADSGVSIMAKGILDSIERLEGGPLKRIVLTHGHPEHAGGIKRIMETHSVPVHAHRIEIPYLEGEIPYRFGKKPVAAIEKGSTQALAEDEHGHLRPIGSLIPYLTPGHSPGHVVYYHEEDQVLLSGDLFTSKNGKLKRPMARHTADMLEAVQSSYIVDRLQPKTLEVTHGSSVFHAAAQLEEYISRESKAIGMTMI